MLAQFLAEFLHERATILTPDTARLMIRNHIPRASIPRGLAFAVGPQAGGAGVSARTLGHTGSTGTLCWADPAPDTIWVVLTSLPATAVSCSRPGVPPPRPRHATAPTKPAETPAADASAAYHSNGTRQPRSRAAAIRHRADSLVR
jgi:CubicO group peptidase (beta-lactamase class C family)